MRLKLIMHFSFLQKSFFPYLAVICLLSVSSICAFYILTNTVWANRVLPNSSIRGVDISMSSKEKLEQIYADNFSLPAELDITIEGITRKLDVGMIKAGYSPGPEEIMKQGRMPLDEFVVNLDLLYIKKEFSPVVLYDENLLDQWLKNNFGELDFVTHRVPELNLKDNGEIASCDTGQQGMGLPYQQLHSMIRNYVPNSSLIFELEKYDFSDSEKGMSQLCADFNELVTKLSFDSDYQVMRYWEVSDVFFIKYDSAQLRVEIKNEKALRAILDRVAREQNIQESYPEIRIYNAKAHFLGEYVPSKLLDIEKTISSLREGIENLDSYQGLVLYFSASKLPDSYQGLPIVYYPVLASTGMAKFRYDKTRDHTIASINKGLAVLEGKLVQADSVFSLIEDGLEAKTFLYSEVGATQANDGNYVYVAGICGVATVMYRAALEAGLPIIERHPHKQALGSYTYPYGALVDAALYLRDDMKQDFRFENNTDYELLIVTDSRLEQGEFNYNIRLFAREGYEKKKVRIGDFWREDKPKGLPFNERFTRYVDGVPEIVESKYYINQL